MQLTIEEISTAKIKSGARAGQDYWKIKSGGVTYYCYQNMISKLEIGAIIEAEIKTSGDKGQYKNIESWTLANQTSLEAPQTLPVVATPTQPIKPKVLVSGEERGMWWKEAGECLRAGLIDKNDNGPGTQLWKAYVKKMLEVIEVTITKPEK
jgi:hypothetical protein